MLRSGLWSQATTLLTQSLPDSSVALAAHLGLAAYYVGNYSQAEVHFSAHPSLALFKISAAVEKAFPKVVRIPQSLIDPWQVMVTGSLGASPTADYIRKLRNFQVTKAQAELDALRYPGESVREMAALAQSHLVFAYRNSQHVGRALTVAEDLGKFNEEGKVLSLWYITHALLLHGKIAQRQGNALIAEALFDAAKEKADEACVRLGDTPRNQVLQWRCLKHKADLLVKWDKRESQGVAILESIGGKYDLTEIADASELFLPPPSLAAVEEATS